jgi:hypothetical protein
MTNSILKSTFVILVTLLSFSISVAQNIKTYKGVFNKGKATYQYYENANLERVYHGHFLFTDSESRLEGEFKDNKKDGLWKYSSISNRYYQNESTLLSGRFDNGQLIGEWKYLKIVKDKQGKVLSKDSKSASFRNNRFSGNIVSWDIIIDINEDGFIDKVTPFKFSVDRIPYEALFEFNNGILCKSIVRNVSTGEIVERFDNSDLVSKFNSQFSAEQKICMVDKNSYTKAVYSLDFFNDATADFDVNGIVPTHHSKCQITDLVQAKRHNSNYSFKFQSLFSSKSDAYEYVTSSILFWFDVASGNIYSFPKGNDTKLVYPQIAMVGINRRDGRVEKVYSEDEMDDEEEETMPVAVVQQVKKFDKNEIFRDVQVMPKFPGGEDSLSAFLQRNLNYQLLAIKDCSGVVNVQFVVNEDGVISDVKVDKNRNLGGVCDDEVVRMVQSMPLWVPGSQDGQNVKVAYGLRVTVPLAY